LALEATVVVVVGLFTVSVVLVSVVGLKLPSPA